MYIIYSGVSLSQIFIGPSKQFEIAGSHLEKFEIARFYKFFKSFYSNFSFWHLDCIKVKDTQCKSTKTQRQSSKKNIQFMERSNIRDSAIIEIAHV